MTSVTNTVSFKRLVYELKCVPWRLGNVGECVTVVLQGYQEARIYLEQQKMARGRRATIGLLWRGRATVG